MRDPAQRARILHALANHELQAAELFAWYHQRGQAENFIKELKRDLAADRLAHQQSVGIAQWDRRDSRR
jgi:IS4 transposase